MTGGRAGGAGGRDAAALLEEERVALPLMLAHSSPRDYRKVHARMTRDFAWWELPHFYRGFTREARVAHATGKGMGIPKIVVQFVLARNFPRYDREIGWLVDELLDPGLRPAHEAARAAAARGGCCVRHFVKNIFENSPPR